MVDLDFLESSKKFLSMTLPLISFDLLLNNMRRVFYFIFIYIYIFLKRGSVDCYCWISHKKRRG